MRNAVLKIANRKGLPQQEALLLLSPVCDALFDFGTGIWRERPEHLAALWDEASERQAGQRASAAGQDLGTGL